MSQKKTIDSLTAKNKLVRYDLEASDNRSPIRLLYLWPPLERCLSRVVVEDTGGNGRASPLEQISAEFDRFLTDDGLTGVGDYVCIMPQKDRVYEIKLPSVRVFGFFPQKGIFVAVSADLKSKVKGHHPQNVDFHRKLVVKVAKRLGLQRLKGEMNVRELL